MDSWQVRTELRNFRTDVNNRADDDGTGKFPDDLYSALSDMIDDNERVRMLIDHYRSVLKDAIR